jgi:L-lactate permease
MGKMLSASSLLVTAAVVGLRDGEGSVCRTTFRHGLMLLLLVTVPVVLGAVATGHIGSFRLF